MANSQWEYTREYESDIRLLPGCWIVVRLDGKGFTKFCELHGFEKPNDPRGLQLMDAAAQEVMHEFPETRLAFGESDEYSFVFPKGTKLYGRRTCKIVSVVASCFTGSYVRLWGKHLPGVPLRSTPTFDARAVCYPCDRTLRDYLCWRQADTHINNLYNTCFWALVGSGKTATEANAALQGTVSSSKNELLFGTFGINYNNLPAQFRKGSVVVWQAFTVRKQREDGSTVEREKRAPAVLHEDIIGDAFWQQHPELLG